MLKTKLDRLRLGAARRLRHLAERMEFNERFPFGNPNISLSRYRKNFMPGFEFATILDIGANIGQSAKRFRELFPGAMIYSFEPLPECCEQMTVAMAGDERFKAFNIALGEESGMRAFQRSSSCASSSFWPMADLHKKNYPHTAVVESCVVRIERLDDVAAQLKLQQDMLVKIDVQGFEEAVLRGGEKTIRQARMLILEVSFLELYHGQMLFPDLVKMVDAWGFKIFRLKPGAYDKETDCLMYTDCVFLRV